LAVFSTIIDNVLPALASKKSGAGKPGVWGSVLGMIGGCLASDGIGIFPHIC